VAGLLHTCLEDTKAELINAMARETELVMTLNEQYFHARKAEFVSYYKGDQLKIITKPPSPPPSPTLESAPPMPEYLPPVDATPDHAYTPDHPNGVSDPAEAVLTALRLLGPAYNNVTVADLAKLLPDDQYAPAIEIVAEVRAYFQGSFCATSLQCSC
jgi:hypothetical protein